MPDWLRLPPNLVVALYSCQLTTNPSSQLLVIGVLGLFFLVSVAVLEGVL